MCGIAGFCHFQQNYLTAAPYWRSILDSMNHVQKHRGPDGEGTYLTEHAGLSHVRLSILDLALGRQPMRRTQNGHDFVLCYNGEIYNMNQLKEELLAKGAVFTTTSDTEVLLEGYLSLGKDFVKKCNGIFSFALWDGSRNTLLLCRDRLGVKPLFYTVSADQTLIFGSEPKALFCHPGVLPELEKKSLQELFGLGPARTPGCGVFADIREVLPGHMLELCPNGMTDTAYWSLTSKPHTDSVSDTIEKTTWLLEDAISAQMLSDIPISTFLSGGIDSSLVTSICAHRLAEKGKKLRTFSFDFQGNDLYFQSNVFQPSQDRPHVDHMREYLETEGCGTEHIYLECDYTQLADWLSRSVDAADLPCMADVDSSLLYFCSQVSDYNKVTLTGECADEIFGGYPWFHKKECFDAAIFPWSMDMDVRSMLLRDDVAKELALEEYAANAYANTLSEVPLLPGEDAAEKRRREISYLNLRWFMATLLNRMDRTSMYSGLEARVPFADHRIVEYLWNIPWNLKCYGGNVKGLLREAAKGWLPEDIRTRRKSPYPKTYHPKYEALLKERFLEVLSSPSAPINTYIDRKKTEAFLLSPSDYGRPFYGQLMAGPQLIAYLLQINYWMEKYFHTTDALI
ncbi:MAG: asparagine synthase (glutamine-hydrolyzing) [Lachnospiraceae bacterium]|nr:asparagine synthase (glutamine-hydrolyzing) [Lachnospiraceae bacterium]